MKKKISRITPVINNSEGQTVLLPDGDPEPTDYELHRQVRQVNLTYTVRLLTRSTKEMGNLIKACYDFLERNHYLEDIPRDPLTPAAGVVRYPLEIVDDFAVVTAPSRANVREAVGSWLIEGVLLETGDIVESAPTLDTIDVTTQQLP